MTSVGVAVIREPDDAFWFASLDGKDWVEVNVDPREVEATREQIDHIMNPPKGDIPLRIARRMLRLWKAEILQEPGEVS